MDLSNVNNLIGCADPIEMPVSELLTGNYIFSIPSYQRGYRWESSETDEDLKDVKQVDDLLNDLTNFINGNSNQKANYYLQPLMVKPRLSEDGSYEWDVLDGQQRLTTILLLLICLNEKLYPNSKLKLYRLKYKNRPNLNFEKISFDPSSSDYDYPQLSSNLDSYYVRKAKDRIERWYREVLLDDTALQDKFKELLFYTDPTRDPSKKVGLRAKFIWFNVAPIDINSSSNKDNILNDIEVFNRLNRGKISLTDSELIKALFLLCIKVAQSSESSLMSADTLVRKWDEMGKKFQDNSFWKMISPKDKEYSNRMDFLFDLIKDCSGVERSSSYRYYYDKMHNFLVTPNMSEVEKLWSEIKQYFDTLCKWHENVSKHNFIGYLVDCGYSVAKIAKDIKDLKGEIKACIGIKDISEIEDLDYQERNGYNQIRKILLLFNVLSCEKFGQKFPFDLYRDNQYDVEHVNSQTDNPIEKIEEKTEWISQHSIPCLWMDRNETDSQGSLTVAAKEARSLILEGLNLIKEFEKNGYRDVGNKFKSYRTRVENFYACGDSNSEMANKDSIGNLTLLNSSINREYKNALFPKKLRILKRSDQEGIYIPLCTKYMFLKYYSNPKENVSAFSMMRWRESDQKDYTEAIKNTIKSIL